MKTTQDFGELVVAAEVLLTEQFGHSIEISDVDCLSEEDRRNLLLRCHIKGAPDDFPASVIMKQVLAGNSEHNQGEYNPNDITSWHTIRFMSDWVGAQFISVAAPNAGHGPHFYGGNLEQGFILMEDLGSHHQSLVESLLGDNAESARVALLAYARRLGQMHADTMGHLDQYAQMANVLHPELVSAQIDAAELRSVAAEQPAKLEALGLPIESAYREEILSVTESILTPGPFLTYIHRDACPDNNVIYPDDTLRLIDFEMGHLGHALLDITYGRMYMPSCWCCNRIPHGLVNEMEATYRGELINGCPEAEDDQLFETALMDACAFWLSRTLNALPQALKEDWDWGIATYRPRIVARLEAYLNIAQKTERRPGYRSTAERLHDELTKRWADMEPLPLYPAFRAP